MKVNRKRKKKINMNKVAICFFALILIICLIIILKPNKTKTPSGVEVVNTGTKSNNEISENDAKKAAIKQFKKIGEKSVKEEDLSIIKIKREDEEYYYIKSSENTLEIKINGGQITRINSATVEE